jgi:glycosyltransferase involved in cell wall biosynthesis
MGTGEGMPEIPLAALRGEFPRMRRSLVLRGLDDDALFRWMSAASALLAPALEEGLGLVPLEALSLGTPVVASAIPAHQEVLGTCAVYRAPHHAEGFAQALVEVMAREPAEREARRAAGAAWARGLSWSASATAFLGSLRTPT